jgi:hypothetical protein
MSQSANALFTFRRNYSLINPQTNLRNFFIFAAKASPWPNDLNPPSVDSSTESTDREICREILFGKFVSNSSIYIMTNRYNWTANTVYAMYDDLDSALFTKPYFVVTAENGQYNVFKCLNNNNGAPSTAQPLLSQIQTQTKINDQYYLTSDGYQWKYMYSIPSGTFATVATSNYIPIISNANVTSNAINGGIQSYMIANSGSYNTYTTGYVTDTIALTPGSAPNVFGLQGSNRTILSCNNSNFTAGETITQYYNGSSASGVLIVAPSTVGSNTILTLSNTTGVFIAGANIIQGTTSGATATLYDSSTPDISSNSHFYDGCAMYIASGTGAGQIAPITTYTVNGNTRRVYLANTFAVTPDFTSKYVIAPQVVINGDGTGAQALAVIDPTTNGIAAVRVVNTGIGYNYANAYTIPAPSGSTASIRPIMSPRLGHGAHLHSELASTFVEYNASFTTIDNTRIPGSGTTYRRVGVIVDPQFANVSLTYNYSSTPNFVYSTANTVTVYGSTSNARGILIGSNPSTNTVQLSNVVGIFQTGDILTSQYSDKSYQTNTASNVAITTVAGQAVAFNNLTVLNANTYAFGGSASALVGNTIYQVNDSTGTNRSASVLASGFIQNAYSVGSNTYLSITEIRGSFQTNKYIYGASNTSPIAFNVTSITQPDLIPYTGNILYVQNIQPVVRNTVQSEVLRLITGFN